MLERRSDDLVFGQVGKFRAAFGESAVWCDRRQGLWWVDMHGHSPMFSDASGATRGWKTPDPELP